MKNEEYFKIGLPKWPALVVTGKPITLEQAKEIIIRTDSLTFSSNDHVFDSALSKIVYGIEEMGTDWDSLEKAISKKLRLNYDENNYKIISEYIKKTKASVCQLESLYYLRNHQVVSSWVGGPHGWCSWDGRIFTQNYNIGKWPSVKNVYEEWRAIAKAFPYLELTAQLFSGETCQIDELEDFRPLITYKVKNGKVIMSKTKKVVLWPKDDDIEATLRTMLIPGGERGCTLTQFKDAFEFTKLKNQQKVL